ncbi:hypothetical protein BD310DRAFT_943708 [Dichomitus squalens]|uniref:Integrase catalytic domain-containing protein n=1 Tax=Dichomitus squalens TaxID=114155 RepID=A0A4Q9QAK7_9APHY|nr:hypothetical protein BD310DRAFT_943708 [Dichomitus squalens]
MVNPTGANGYDNGTVPPEDELIAALQQYAREELPLSRRLQHLGAELGYHIKKAKLKKLNRKYNIPTSRKPPPLPLATTLICEQMANDPHRHRGPTAVKSQLALEGFNIPWAIVREVMHANDDIGPTIRNPRSRSRHIVRVTLTSHGTWHEVSVDGHEKLSDKALQMGIVGFHIYGGRDKWSGKVLLLLVLPNSRFAEAIGHVYLDFVIEHEMIPIQVTFDGGSETADMKAIQTALRNTFAPDLDPSEWPPFMPIPSTRNITIENLWSRWFTHSGANLQKVLMEGKTNGLFNPGDNWLWSQVTQQQLDAFKAYWNSHHVRTQRNKLMPSGSTPNDFFATPEQWGGRRDKNCGIPIDADVAEALRAQINMRHEDAYKFVDDSFRQAAENAYETIGSPALTVQNGWEVFAQMKLVLHTVYASGM